jgi:hypothetical protein
MWSTEVDFGLFALYANNTKFSFHFVIVNNLNDLLKLLNLESNLTYRNKNIFCLQDSASHEPNGEL